MKSTAMTLLVFVSVIVFGRTGSSAGNRGVASQPALSVIGDALYCMEGEKSGVKATARNESAYRIKYIYGVIDPKVDAPNELHLISYDKDMNSAWLYELLMERGSDSGITLTWINTAHLRRKDGHWTVEETLGGVYSYQRVLNLADRISKQEERLVSMPTSRPQGLVCKSH